MTKPICTTIPLTLNVITASKSMTPEWAALLVGKLLELALDEVAGAGPNEKYDITDDDSTEACLIVYTIQTTTRGASQ